ncbi:MAG TPA: transporter substrate-binding domain-containing protein [Stellaceae bacterium]|jgi:polar amino acid transport system substrate-binding protein|nr:transporter substrate-binding domain-containing protein [Stellaceae bacterium]
MTIAVRAIRLSRRVALALAAVLALAAAWPAEAGALDDIRARGQFVVGTKADYQPFGFRDGSGAVVGFEPDLAREIAKALGVSLKLVPVVATNRVALLQSGQIDLIIATMNDTPERRKQVDFVEPSYYASGVNVLAPKSARLHVWQELRGKPVCSVEGSFYIAEIQARYAPEMHLYKDTSQVYAAVKAGECVAAYDDAAIIGQLQMDEWRDYEMPLRSILVQPWGMAVKPGNAELAVFVGGLVKKWHAAGHIEALEKTWAIPPSVFAQEMHRRYADAD